MAVTNPNADAPRNAPRQPHRLAKNSIETGAIAVPTWPKKVWMEKAWASLPPPMARDRMA